MDLLRRSFRRGSIRRRPQREPLAESPSFDSPSSPLDDPSIRELSNSPMDRLRRSFRRNFRFSCGEAPVTSTSNSSNSNEPSSMMDRLRSSFRRSTRRKGCTDATGAKPLPPTPTAADKLRQSFRRIKDDYKDHRSEDNATVDKLKRSFRRSLRRRKKEPPGIFGMATAATTTTSSSGLHQWQSDEMDVRAGTCFFNVKYLGCVEVFEPRGILMCEEAFKILRKSRKRPMKSILFVSVNGLRVAEKNTRTLIVDQSIDMLSFCGPVRLHDRGFSFICLNVATLKWMCYCFVAKESGERLSNAVGCAFAIYFELKKNIDKECMVTMSFDLSSSTFTRIGSFKHKSVLESLREKMSSSNDIDTSAGRTNATLPGPTIININNNITTDYDENKENIPCHRPMNRMRAAHDFERSLHSVSASLRRQRSFRELPRDVNHDSSTSSSPTFKRHASLRLRELPSNIERMKSLSADFTLDARSKFLRHRTPISPIVEVSPANTPDKLKAGEPKTSCVDSAVRQQLSRKFNTQPQSNEPNQSHVLRELTPRTLERDRPNLEANLSNCSGQSHQPSTFSSFEGITLTPPATPSPAKFAQLLEVDYRPSNGVANAKPEEKLTTTTSSDNILSAIIVPDTSARSSSTFAFNSPGRRRAHSLSYAENVSNSTSDPFDINWSLWTNTTACKEKEQQVQQQLKKKKNTNPFLPNSPDTPEKSENSFSNLNLS